MNSFFEGIEHRPGSLQTATRALCFKAESATQFDGTPSALSGVVRHALKECAPLPPPFRQDARALIAAAMDATFESLPAVLQVDQHRDAWAPTEAEAATIAACMPGFGSAQQAAHWQQRSRLAAWAHDQAVRVALLSPGSR